MTVVRKRAHRLRSQSATRWGSALEHGSLHCLERVLQRLVALRPLVDQTLRQPRSGKALNQIRRPLERHTAPSAALFMRDPQVALDEGRRIALGVHFSRCRSAVTHEAPSHRDQKVSRPLSELDALLPCHALGMFDLAAGLHRGRRELAGGLLHEDIWCGTFRRHAGTVALVIGRIVAALREKRSGCDRSTSTALNDGGDAC